MMSLQKEFDSMLDQLVSRFGLVRSVKIIRSLVEDKLPTLTASEMQKLIIEYTVQHAILLFGLSKAEFDEAISDDARDARMASIYVLSTVTGYSYRHIGEHFGMNNRSIRYFKHKCLDFLKAPGYYRDFATKYDELENRVIALITKLE